MRCDQARSSSSSWQLLWQLAAIAPMQLPSTSCSRSTLRTRPCYSATCWHWRHPRTRNSHAWWMPRVWSTTLHVRLLYRCLFGLHLEFFECLYDVHVFNCMYNKSFWAFFYFPCKDIPSCFHSVFKTWKCWAIFSLMLCYTYFSCDYSLNASAVVVVVVLLLLLLALAIVVA